MQDVRLPLTILTKAAQQLGLVVENSDEVSQAVLRVSDGTRHFFAGLGKIGMYPLNLHFAAALANDKAWTYQVLTQAGFKTPRGEHFFLSDTWKAYQPIGRDVNAACVYAATLGYPVFVKPNDGSSGVLAELIPDESVLQAHLQQVVGVSQVALVQEYINQPEHRLFVIDGRVEFMYQRTKPIVVGDGVKTIAELLADLNSQILITSHQIKLDSPFIKSELQRLNLHLDSVLSVGQHLVVAAHANLATGGAMTELTETIPTWLHDWAAGVTQSLGLRVAGIDVFSALPLTDPNAVQHLIIIEVNSNPNLAGIYTNGARDMAINIWKKILLKYFDKN